VAKSEISLVKHTLNLYEGDYRKLQDLYPDTGAGVIIRRIVRSFLNRVEAGQTAPELTEEIAL